MASSSFRLRGWASWVPGGDDGDTVSMPALLRRRVTPIGRHALKVGWNLAESAQARLVFSSRHGEFSRTLSLLESVTDRTGLSPADFTLSVHHAMAGLLSIAQSNHHGHTAIAAGSESFCYGLMEAAACLKENPDEPVVLIHYDDLLPGPYANFNEPEERPVVLALALAATGGDESFEFRSEPVPLHEAPPESHALHFLEFLTSGTLESCSIDSQRQWRWMRHAVA